MLGKFNFVFIFLFLIGCISSNESISSGNTLTVTGICDEVTIFEEGRVDANNIETSAGFTVEEVEVEGDRTSEYRGSSF